MIKLRTILLLCTALLCGIYASAQNRVASYHTIEKGETLYHLTQVYKVTAEAICAINPGLSAENFQAGKTIAIPVGNGQVEQAKKVEVTKSTRPEGSVDSFQDMHKVKKHETIYGIAKQYGITEEELRKANPELQAPDATLKKGSYICIPFKTIKVVEEVEPDDKELFEKNKPSVFYFGKLKVALMLPFGTTDKSKKASSTMYYRGFMLAVDSLKNLGVNMDLTICNTGRDEEKVDSLLRTSTIQDLDLLFTPMIEQSEKKISNFSKEHQIRLVMTQSNEVNSNPYLFTMNTGIGKMYEDVTSYFVQKFPKANIIFLEMNDPESSTGRGGLVNHLKQGLDKAHINYSFLPLNSSTEAILKALSSARRNVIVPNSASLSLMKKFMTKWKKIAAENTKYRISVFGHKEWLSMATEMKASFYALDTYIYSKFWFNPGNAASKHLANNYNHWFNVKLPTIMPSVPAIGFDTAFYMIKGLQTYGTAFEQNLKEMNIQPYQNFIEFERMGTYGGFANTKIGYVHFNKKVVNVEY